MVEGAEALLITSGQNVKRLASRAQARGPRHLAQATALRRHSNFTSRRFLSEICNVFSLGFSSGSGEVGNDTRQARAVRPRPRSHTELGEGRPDTILGRRVLIGT